MSRNAIGTNRQTPWNERENERAAEQRPEGGQQMQPPAENPCTPARMAGHHWTHLDGWDLSVWSHQVASHDATREQLGEELVAICDEAGEPIGGLLLQSIVLTGLHMVMLGGQSALEERITVHNAKWLMDLGAPSRGAVDRIILSGHQLLADGHYWVTPVPSRSTVTPDRQRETEALVGQLAPVPV